MAAATFHTVEAPARHRPDIRRTLNPVNGRFVYRLLCVCGAVGEEHAARRLAQADLDQHLLSLPRVPAGQQCRTPRRHNRRYWEPCQLCEYQQSLFTLEGAR